jgi:protein arginine N-methyltransferase 1
MSLELDEHRQYLEDDKRLTAFARAISATVRPGDVVVDLGCGTGILGFLACRAGAARVYAIDASGMVEVARLIAAANGLADRIAIINGYSQHVSLPERADVVLCDQIGHFGFEAGLLQFFEDARRRFLKPDGRFLPLRVRLSIAPVEIPALWRETSFWATRPSGFDMSPAQEIAWNSGHPWRVEPDHLLGPGRMMAALTPGQDNSYFSVSTDIAVDRPGTLHGIAGWFTADLDETTTLTNAPGDPERIARRNVVLPVRRALTVQPGQILRVQMQLRPYDLLVKWVVEQWPDGAAACGRDSSRRLDRLEHSTFAGMLLSADVVRRTRPAFVPRLVERGRARKLVLDLIDGRSSVADIERALFDRYPTLFVNSADAGGFVAEVVTRYAE